MRIEAGSVAIIWRSDDETNVGTLVRVSEQRDDGPVGDMRQSGWWHIVPACSLTVRLGGNKVHFVCMDQAKHWVHSSDMVPMRDLHGVLLRFDPQLHPAEPLNVSVH